MVTAQSESAPSTSSRPSAAEIEARVAQASAEASRVLSFASLHLRKEPYPREAARQAVRLAKEWLDKHARLAGLSAEFASSTYAKVEAVVRQALPAAKLEEPDTALDALFRADYLTRLADKRWREAILVLDEYLARDPENGTVQAMKRTRLNQARNFLEGKLKSADNAIAQADREKLAYMRAQLAFQLETGGLETWADQLRQCIQRIDAALAPK